MSAEHLDIARMRAETPGCSGRLTHLNNAGAALKPRAVVDAVARHLALEEEVGGYEAAAEAADAVRGSYGAVARLINADPSEIAFVDSATRGWHVAFLALDLKPGDEILTSQAEYNSHMISFRHAEKRLGTKTILVPDADDGSMDCDALQRLITDRTRLISLSHIPTNDGIVQPAEAVGRIARAHAVPYLLDACQSAGQMPLDVAAIGCTMLTATGRKYLRGPRGTGFLWVDRNWQDRLLPHTLDIRSARWTGVDRFEIVEDAGRYELWEGNVAAQIGLGEAADYAVRQSIDLTWARIVGLAARLRALIAALPGFTVHDRGSVKSGIVTFSCRSHDAAHISNWLRQQHTINTSVSAVQLTRADLLSSGVTHLVRASVHAFNTDEEIERLASALHLLASGDNKGRSSGIALAS